MVLNELPDSVTREFYPGKLFEHVNGSTLTFVRFRKENYKIYANFVEQSVLFTKLESILYNIPLVVQIEIINIRLLRFKR